MHLLAQSISVVGSLCSNRALPRLRRSDLRTGFRSPVCALQEAVTEMSTEDMPRPLEGREDKYGGLIVDPESLPESSLDFSRQLRSSLQEYVMMTYWIPDTPCSLPANASHQVGVGAFVLNDKQEVLAVQERNGPLKGMGVWKMPTGLLHAGEDLDVAAEREVLEETGVVAKFDAVLAMRQAHSFMFDKSDMFFVCALRCDSRQQVCPQESEIEAVRWMPLEEFLSIKFMRNRPLLSTILDSCEAFAQGRYSGMRAAKLESGGFRKSRDLLVCGGVPPAAEQDHLRAPQPSASL